MIPENSIETIYRSVQQIGLKYRQSQVCAVDCLYWSIKTEIIVNALENTLKSLTKIEKSQELFTVRLFNWIIISKMKGCYMANLKPTEEFHQLMKIIWHNLRENVSCYTQIW